MAHDTLTAESEPQTARHFEAQLKLLDAVMLVVGAMIGSGIFIVSADIARNMNSSGG
jgi:APA family basic amino acid/polyamine antiporter